jgi:hypothetical protein
MTDLDLKYTTDSYSSITVKGGCLVLSKTT